MKNQFEVDILGVIETLSLAIKYNGKEYIAHVGTCNGEIDEIIITEKEGKYVDDEKLEKLIKKYIIK
jgi:hypothetical protein